MRATPLQFTRPFHHIHPPLPRRFDMLRSIQGRKVATRGDRLCVRYAYSGCTCAILNRTMPNVLAPFHSYIPIHAPIQPSRASTCPFARSKTHLITYVAARDSTYASLHMAGRRRTSSWSLGARDGSFCASRRHIAIAPLLAWQGPVVGDPDRSHRSLQLQPQPWRGHCRLRAMVVASRRGGQPLKVRSSTLTHPQPIPHPCPHPRRRFCRLCCVPTDPSRAPCSGAHFGNPRDGIARLLRRVRRRSRRLSISTARAARVRVRRAGGRGRGGERRARDCDLVLSGWGLSEALGRHSNIMYDVCDASLYKNSIVPASNDIREPENVLN